MLKEYTPGKFFLLTDTTGSVLLFLMFAFSPRLLGRNSERIPGIFPLWSTCV